MDNEMINEAYRHARIHLREEQLKEILPESVIGICKSKKTIMFGSTDGLGNLLAIALFSASGIENQEMVLEYVEVAEERRQEGLAHELVTYCAREFKNCGIRSIYLRIVGEIAEIAEAYDYLARERYIPVVFNGHICSYEFSDIRQCELMRHGGELMRAFGRKIKTLEQHLDAGVRQFMQQKTGTHIKQDVYDAKYSSVLLDEDCIKGVMFFAQTGKKTLTLTGCYIERDNNSKYVFAALLFYTMHELAASAEDDAEFVLQLYRQEQYEWAKKMLGQPRQDLILQEYVRKL